MGIVLAHECELFKKQLWKYHGDYGFGAHMKGADPEDNSATVDRIIKLSDGHWYIRINAEEYAVMVRNCPFCGVELA